MGRIKYTYQDILEIFENEGYMVLSKEDELLNEKGFIYSTTKIKIKCKNGHVTTTMTINNFNNGKRCRKCADEKISKNRRLTYEEVKEYIESFGYELLSERYTNMHEYIIVKPPCGHDAYKVTFNHFKQGCRCPKCSDKLTSLKLRHDYEYVKEYIGFFGYELLSEEYINSLTKIQLRCPLGHIYKTTFNNFKNHKMRCPHCSTHISYSYEYIKEYIESFNYKLLSEKEEYLHTNTNLILQCPKNHITKTMTFSRFRQGHRCKKCADEELGEKRKYSYKYVKEYVEKEGYILLSKEYDGINSYIKLECPNGHIYDTGTFGSFKQGYRCSHCNRVSKGEQRIMNLLDKFKIDYIHDKGYFQDLSINNHPLRPDFIIENKRIWIEYDGGQHFKIVEYFGGLMNLLNIKYRDNIKNKYAKENGWKMIRIPYWEFDNIEEILIKELELK